MHIHILYEILKTKSGVIYLSVIVLATFIVYMYNVVQ
jgi:hypothetical protein